MFLITVIDSEDSAIGKRCETDLIEISYAIEELSDWLGMEMEEPKIIQGEDFSKEAVTDAINHWLREQEPASNDVVVFYYSGHGFRFPDDTSEYPRMWLKTSEDQNTATASLRLEEDIFAEIVKLGAGVNLILSDCCNTSVAGDNGQFNEVAMPAKKKKTQKRKKSAAEEAMDEPDNADKLFAPGGRFSILVNAAGPGEFAGGKSETGGFFTTYLVEALGECIYEEKLEPTWESIFSYADEKASFWARSAACPQARHNEKGRCIQKARYKKVLPE